MRTPPLSHVRRVAPGTYYEIHTLALFGAAAWGELAILAAGLLWGDSAFAFFYWFQEPFTTYALRFLTEIPPLYHVGAHGGAIGVYLFLFYIVLYPDYNDLPDHPGVIHE